MAKHIYLIAGEASGDFLGAQLMKALKAKDSDTRFSGIGGPLMEAQGLNSLFPMNELSLMGVFEILPKIKHLLGRIKETAHHINQLKPDMVVSIDAPDFSFRVHKRVRKICKDQAPSLVHYVAPTVWAWRPGRAKKIAKFLDYLICLFHFEPQYFEKEGLKAIAVGHPMMESSLLEAKPLYGDDKKRLGVFFGSRQGEIKRLSPVLIRALKDIIKAKPDIELIIPTLPHLKDQIEALLNDLEVPKHIHTDHADKWSVFKSCDAALAVSGTVGLELSACNVPHLIAYKMNTLTAMIARKLIRTPYAHLANIIMSKEIVPEFIQENCDEKAITAEAIKLIDDDQVRIAQQNSFEDVRAHILGPNKKPPSDVAASYLLDL